MKYKVCVFDIDGVLNRAGEPVQKESIEAIKKLEAHGLKISFASGKHPWYITGGLVFSGLLRKDTIVIGEAGGHVFFPQSKKSILHSAYIKDIRSLKKIFYEQKIFAHDVWEEPKEVIFSLFPRDREKIPELVNGLQKVIQEEKFHLYVVQHVDAVDVMQNGLSKEVGLKVLCDRLNILMNEMIACGDGMNDYEMLECVGYPVAVANAEDEIKRLVREKGGYIAEAKYGKGVLEATDYLIKNVL